MPHFHDTADQLRLVRQAEERFLALYALDCLLAETRFFDKLSADIQETDSTAPPTSSDPGGWSMSQ